MEIVFKLFNCFVCVVEVYLIVDFYAAFFRIREIFNYRYTQPIVIGVTAVLVRIVNTLNSSSINLLAMQIIYFSILLILFNGSVWRKIFCFLIADIIMIGCEFAWIVLMSLPSEFSIYQIEENQYITMITILGVKALAFFFFNLLKRSAKRDNYAMRMQNLLIYCIVPLATVGIIVSLAYLNIDFDNGRFLQTLLLGSVSLSVIGNILVFYVFDNYTSAMERVRQQELIITRLEMEEKRYEQIEAVNQAHAGFLHDIRHYLKTIYVMAEENKDYEILKIIPELQVKISDADMEMYCSNRMLNTILNEKKKAAAERKIDFKLTIEPEFRIDQIENVDLIVIMGNLLENAIDAASKCEDGFIKIYLFSQNEGCFSVLKIINNYCTQIKVKEDKLLTSKTDKGMHGFGIQNVTQAVEKYNGNFQYFYENGIFTAIVVLPNIRN